MDDKTVNEIQEFLKSKGLSVKEAYCLTIDFKDVISNSKAETLDEVYKEYQEIVNNRLKEYYANYTHISDCDKAKVVDSGVTYSGCNYYINKGVEIDEPLGTATAMHECLDSCPLDCKDRRKCETWSIVGGE